MVRQCVMNQKILVSKPVWLLRLCIHTGFSLLEGDEGIPPTSGVSRSGGAWGASHDPPIKIHAPHEVPPYLKMKPTPHPPPEKHSPPSRNEVPFQKMISRKKYPKNWKLPLILVFYS